MTKSVRKSYDVSFKLQVLSDYYLSGKSKSFTCRKWGISFPALLEWLKIWPVRKEELPLLDEIIAKYPNLPRSDKYSISRMKFFVVGENITPSVLRSN